MTDAGCAGDESTVTAECIRDTLRDLVRERDDLQAALDAEREKAAQQGRYAVDLFDEIQRMKKAWREERTGFESDLVKADTERDKLQALVRALVGTKSFTINGPDIRTMSGNVLYACSSQTSAERLGALLEYRERTLDATTPSECTNQRRRR